MNDIASRVSTLSNQIRQASLRSGRAADSVQLLAVSKTRSVSEVEQAFAAGCHRFGESYVQDALPKIAAFAGREGIEWHFIGPIQSNKTKSIAEHFDWVHSIDRLKIAQRLSEQRPPNLAPLNICIQVNITGEETKSGISSDQVLPLAQQIVMLPNIRLRGLMTVPKNADSMTQTYQTFIELRELMNTLNKQNFQLDTLSMGMTHDMDVAIQAGSTIVRVGTGIFGPR